MALPDSSRFQLTPDMSICRVLNGMWQVSGAHGPIESGAAIFRHFTLALRFATPAALCVSITCMESASSSQSWLVPSGDCVATVRVYS